MEAADVNSIEGILNQYVGDGLLEPYEFARLLQELQHRESVMIEDALSQAERKRITK